MTEASAGDVLRGVREFFPSELVTEQALAGLLRVADRLRAPTAFLVECGLSESADSADLSLCFARASTPRPSFVLDRGDARPAAHPVWDRLRQLDASWATPGSPLWRWVRALWLEFDIRSDMPPPPAGFPSIFFGEGSGLRHVEAIQDGLSLIAGEDAPLDAVNALSRCLVDLPRPFKPVFVGFMSGRVPASVRLCLYAAVPGLVPAYLDKVGVKVGADLEHLLARLPVLTPYTVLQLEMTDRLSSRVGLECYRERAARGRAEAWKPLVDRLTELGLCSAEKRDALVRWPGYAYREEPGPDAGVICRWINHVKITCDPSGLVEAKAYLQAGPALRL